MSSVPNNGCPSLAVLDEAARAETIAPDVQQHVRDCPECQAVLVNMRSNNDFLAEHRHDLAARAAGPAIIPGCTLLGEIHRGGQGIVYKAIQTATQRTVAVKVLRVGALAGREERSRFEREARILGQLQHPNIVTVHDSGTAGGLHYLVLDYVDGRTLDRHVGDGSPDIRTALALFEKICDAVHAAHLRGIIHRDLKPGNVLIDAAGEPHLLDFGLAKATVDTAEMTRMTLTGQFFGTPAWASPEQADGDMTGVDLRTDVYALGLLLYYLLTGAHPYDVSGTFHSVLENVRFAVPASPRLRRPQVDSEVETIVLKSLQKDRERRYQTAGELALDIRRYLAGEAIEAKRDSTWYVLSKVLSRNRLRVAVAGVALLVLPVFSIWMTVLYQRARAAEQLSAARSTELVEALSASNVERGRTLAAAGNTPLAEQVVWPEMLSAVAPRAVDHNPPITPALPPALNGFVGSSQELHAYWALWDIFRRSSCVATLRTGGTQIELLYFDEDDRRLNAFDDGGKLVSWSVETWQPVRESQLVTPIEPAEIRRPGIPPDPAKLFQSALASDGRIAVFGGGAIRVIDPEAGIIDAQAPDPDNTALTGAISPDGALLATIGRDNRLRLRDTRSLAVILVIPESITRGTSDEVTRPSFSLDGSLVAATLPDGSIGLWNTVSGLRVRTLCPPDSLAAYVSVGVVPARIAFGPDGTIVAPIGICVGVWPGDGAVPINLQAHKSPSIASFLPRENDRVLVTSGNDVDGSAGGATSFWDPVSFKRTAHFVHPEYPTACTGSADGRWIAVGDEFGVVRVYSTVAEPHVQILQKRTAGAIVAAVSPDGRFAAWPAYHDGGMDVVVVDLRSRTQVTRIPLSGPQVFGLEFAPDGSSLFTGQTDGRILQWDLPAATIRSEFTAPEPADVAPKDPSAPVDLSYVMGLNQMRLSPDGRVLARGRKGGLIDVWDVPSGRWTGNLDSGRTDRKLVAFSPDSRTLAAAENERCVLWELDTRQITRTIEYPEGGGNARFSADGAVLAHGVGGRIRWVEVATGRVISETNDPASGAMAMVFHPGGAVFFTAAGETIRLWDVRNGRELLTLQKHTALIFSLSITPDGNTLISADRSGRVLAWDLTCYNDRIRRELSYRISQSPAPGPNASR